MSYPGYPYPQGGSNNSPYPQQGAPYPPGGYPNSAPYPTPYPNQGGGVFPPSLGFSAGAPVYMPQQQSQPGYPPAHGAPSFPPSAYPPGSYPPGSYPPGAYPQPSYPYPSHPSQPPVNLIPHDETESPPDDAIHLEPEHHEAPVPFSQGNPTVFPSDPFNPSEDAEILRKAMKGIGTDEKAIINVLGRRTNAERMEIAIQFKTMYGKDLLKDLRSESSGNFKRLLTALMTPLPQLYAQQINDSLSGIGTDEEVLIEVLCTMSNHEIQTIRAAYEADFGHCLEEDLRSDTSGTFKRLLVSLCTAGRDESMVTDLDAAIADAQKLLEAGELQWGTDESAFNMILCQRNYAQLQLIFEEYEQLSGNDIENTIKSEFSGDSESAFLALVRSIRNKPHFFAKSLHDAIAGLGTKDNKLIRITAARCEIDMADIKGIYEAKYGESLMEAIKGDTSGHYMKLLLTLIGEL